MICDSGCQLKEGRLRDFLVLGCAAAALLGFLIIGSLTAPDRYKVTRTWAATCVSSVDRTSTWNTPSDLQTCLPVYGVQEPAPAGPLHLDVSQVLPLEDNEPLLDTAWNQKLTTALLVFIQCGSDCNLSNPTVTMEVRLGSQHTGDGKSKWTELAHHTIARQMTCVRGSDASGMFKCELLPFFELLSLPGDAFLVNIRISNVNNSVIKLEYISDIDVITVLEDKRFTRAWLWLKSVLTVVQAIVTFLYCRKMLTTGSSKLILHRSIIAVVFCLMIYNTPVGWLTVTTDIPAMFIVHIIRDGALLLSFMVYTILVVNNQGNSLLLDLSANRTPIAVVCFLSALLVAFRITMISGPLVSPLTTMWTSTLVKQVALCVFAVIVFLYSTLILYLIVMTVIGASRRRGTCRNTPGWAKESLTHSYLFRCVTSEVCVTLALVFIVLQDVTEGRCLWGGELTPDNIGVVHIAPAPTSVMNTLTVKCFDDKRAINSSKWFNPRGKHPCQQVISFHDASIEEKRVQANQIVFAQWIPLVRDNEQLDMSRWFQNMIGVIQMDIAYNKLNPMGLNPKIQLEVRLGYRYKDDPEDGWKELARATEDRQLHCSLKENETDIVDGEYYDCDLLPFFELGSVHYDYYLINIRIPVSEKQNINLNLGQIEDLHVVTIFQNGGFTTVWFTMKTVVFPFLLAVLVWFWRRIQQLSRLPNLLERTLFALGIILSIMNLPIEWFTLRFNMPYMLLLGDIRQGAFYAMLLSFWVIFAGEHMMDSVERNKLGSYWKHLSAIVFGCLCLFVFEMCERGMQLTNPFFSIWSTTVGTNLALAFIILAGFSACLYFMFLCYMIFKVFRNISAKKASLSAMSSVRRKFYSGLIYRFKFLMLATLVCAALTVIFFIISQVSEGSWKWGDENISLEYSSAFLTGVYGMWNVYVIGLLSLYAPSHKLVTSTDSNDSSQEEEVQLTQIPSEGSALSSEASALTSYVSKTATD